MARYVLLTMALLVCAGTWQGGCARRSTRAAARPATPVEPAAPRPAPTSDLECPEQTVARGAGPPAGQRVWCEDASGREHGPAKRWYASGEKKSEGSYDRGRMHGLWVSWYRNGNKRSEGSFDHGSMSGTWQAWYESGELRRRVRYDGNRGELVAWDRDGTKRREGVYVDGRPLRGLKEWDEQGEPIVRDPPSSDALAGSKEDVGVPECDALLAAYLGCVQQMPASAQPQIREAIDQMRVQWRAVSGGSGRDTLASTCREAHAQLEKVLQPMGCLK